MGAATVESNTEGTTNSTEGGTKVRPERKFGKAARNVLFAALLGGGAIAGAHVLAPGAMTGALSGILPVIIPGLFRVGSFLGMIKGPPDGSAEI